MKLGLDFGGVISVLRDARGGDTQVTEGEGLFRAQPGAMDAISKFVVALEGRVWIVSKAGAAMQERTLEWLDRVDFYVQTGFRPEHVHFCREREQKGPLCAGLGITHFVDDRVHVMQILQGIVPRLYLFGSLRPKAACPPWATHVAGWAEAEPRLLADIADAP